MRNRFVTDPEGEYQEYLGEVITRNSQRDYQGEQRQDSYRRPNPDSPRFSQAADDRRQLKSQARVDRSPIMQAQLLATAPRRTPKQFSGR